MRFKALPGIILIGLLAYFFVIQPYLAQQRFDAVRQQPVAPTISEVQRIQEYQHMAAPVDLPQGAFEWSGKYQDQPMTIKYFFGRDNQLTKELLLLEKYRASGTATYAIKGSTLVFSNVRGDKALFPELGEAAVLGKDEVKLIGDTTVFVLHRPSAMPAPAPVPDSTVAAESPLLFKIGLVLLLCVAGVGVASAVRLRNSY